MADYAATRDRVEDYFDRTATKAWERLTSDAPVSRIRATVRAGRDRMRALMLSRLPADLTGLRIMDAGCGTGLMTAELAARGANVVAVDLSPALIQIARSRLPDAFAAQVTFHAGDLTDPALGRFDHVVAMDSLIYYAAPDLSRVLRALSSRTTGPLVFTVAPKTPFLMAFWGAGKLFPRSDRSPVMVPHSLADLRQRLDGELIRVERISSGFYISDCLEYRA
jgi:magnesium-protoporphyrin O-methyltransferase